MANAQGACNNEEKLPVQVTPQTAQGRPAQIQPGTLVAEVVSGNVTVEPVDDGNFFIVSGDLPGSSQVAVKGDADLGDGVVEITALIDVEVSGASAASFGVSVGAPVPK